MALPDRLIREAEENMENNIRGPQESRLETGIPFQGSTTKISLYPPHENRKIEKKGKRKTSADQWRSRKSGKNER